MDSVSQRDALRVIQEIVSREKGGPLGTAGVRELETVLAGLASAGAQIPSAAAGYSCHEATIVFADLRGFSAIAARHPPEVVLAELDRYFSRMVEIIAAHHGAVDKFIGDAIMAVFHADPALPGDHARRAVLCAIEMQLAMRELGAQARSMAALYLGIGKSPRVPLIMRLDYWLIEDKVVATKSARGRARDLGYHGMLAELPSALRMHTELKLAFDLPCVDYSAREVYARVVYIAAEGAHWLAGLEFTSLSGEAEDQVRRCVQMLLQGGVGGT